MITIENINAWRVSHGYTPFLSEAKPGSDIRPRPDIIATLKENIAEFEKSPKRRGNREHFRMLLMVFLTDDHATELAFGDY